MFWNMLLLVLKEICCNFMWSFFIVFGILIGVVVVIIMVMLGNGVIVVVFV